MQGALLRTQRCNKALQDQRAILFPLYILDIISYRRVAMKLCNVMLTSSRISDKFPNKNVDPSNVQQGTVPVTEAVSF
jgi:hypothetical protein